MIELDLYKRNADRTLRYTMGEIGTWLDANMPNPYIEKGVDYKPRWVLDTAELTIKFANDEDATLFALRFA